MNQLLHLLLLLGPFWTEATEDTGSTAKITQVMRGIFIRYSKPSDVIYSESTRISFSISFGYSTTQDFYHRMASRSCNEIKSRNRTMCTFMEHLSNNLQHTDERLKMLVRSATNNHVMVRPTLQGSIEEVIRSGKSIAEVATTTTTITTTTTTQAPSPKPKNETSNNTRRRKPLMISLISFAVAAKSLIPPR